MVDKQLDENVLIVDQNHDHPKLLTKQLRCKQLDWGHLPPNFPIQCTAKSRYRQQDQACEVIQISDDELEVTFKESQWAVTPGQSIVFYHQEHCLGGGIIK